jgi:hypothetical protein
MGGKHRISIVGSVLTILPLAGCVPPGIACPAIGFVYVGPVLLDIDAAQVADGGVAACLGQECEPVPVARGDDGGWSVPQEPPYVGTDTIGLNPAAGVRVVITDASGAIVRDRWSEIPSTSTSDGFCPGPAEYGPVVVR